MQASDVCPEADEQKRITDLKLLMQQAMTMYGAAASKADYCQSLFAPGRNTVRSISVDSL